MLPLFSDTLHQVWFRNLKRRSYGSLCTCSFERADSKVHLQGGGGGLLSLFNLLLYVFLGPFSSRANGDEKILSLFPGPPHGARLQRPYTNHIMSLFSVFTRLTNTQNMPCYIIFCLFCPNSFNMSLFGLSLKTDLSGPLCLSVLWTCT